MSDFENWLKETNWALSLLAAIPLAIIANLLTISVRNWLARRSAIKAKKRLKELEDDLKKAETYIDDREKLYLFLARGIFSVLIFIALGSAMSSIMPLLSGPIGSIFYLVAILRAYQCLNMVKNISNFDKYKGEILSQINQMKALAGEQ